MKKIQSKKHKLGTYKISKISLSCFDDKRYVRWVILINVTSCNEKEEIKKDYNKEDCDN